MRGSHENGDIFFQHREACNKYYDALPAIVEEYMGKVNAKLGTDYQLFNYYGAADADRVIIAMGSICDVAEEVIDYLNAQGREGRPGQGPPVPPVRPRKSCWLPSPQTCKKIAVLDRTKEPGAQGEPLYLDVVTALANAGKADIQVIGGRYGLGSKDTPPASVFAVYEELAKSELEASVHHRHRRRRHEPLPRGARSPRPTPPRKAPSSANSGAWAATAPLARTKTPSRSSATIPTSMCRPTSSTTLRRPAA